MILYLSFPGGGGEQGSTTNGVLLNALGATHSGSWTGSSNTVEEGSLSPALVNALKEFSAAACGLASSQASMATLIRTRDHARTQALPMEKAGMRS